MAELEPPVDWKSLNKKTKETDEGVATNTTLVIKNKILQILNELVIETLNMTPQF